MAQCVSYLKQDCHSTVISQVVITARFRSVGLGFNVLVYICHCVCFTGQPFLGGMAGLGCFYRVAFTIFPSFRHLWFVFTPEWSPWRWRCRQCCLWRRSALSCVPLTCPSAQWLSRTCIPLRLMVLWKQILECVLGNNNEVKGLYYTYQVLNLWIKNLGIGRDSVLKGDDSCNNVCYFLNCHYHTGSY